MSSSVPNSIDNTLTVNSIDGNIVCKNYTASPALTLTLNPR